MIIIFIITIYFYIIPIQLCFDIFYDDEIEEIFELFNLNHNLGKFIIAAPEILLVFDTLLKFITGFYEDGIVVVDKSMIFSHYIRKGLIFDILSYFPVVLQGILRTNFPQYFEHHPIIIKELQLLMFFKLKRVKIALLNFEEIITSKGSKDFLLSSFRLIYVILFVTHLNACIWHACAYYHLDSDSITWLDESNLTSQYWLIKYFYSFYWAMSITTTIGYGERISPQNTLEIIFGTGIIIVSLFLFGFSINYMKQILDSISKQEDDHK